MSKCRHNEKWKGVQQGTVGDVHSDVVGLVAWHPCRRFQPPSTIKVKASGILIKATSFTELPLYQPKIFDLVNSQTETMLLITHRADTPRRAFRHYRGKMNGERNLTPVRQPIRFNIDNFYRRCTTDQLRDFIANRRRSHVCWPRRQACLAILKQLDQAATFRFLALPNDIRLIIYDELLLFDNEPDRTLCPQILATCKKINEEATPIFQQNFRTTTVVRINYEETPVVDKPTFRLIGPSCYYLPTTCWYDSERGSWSKLAYTRRNFGWLEFKAAPEVQNKGHLLVYLRLDARVGHIRSRLWEHIDALVQLINARDSKIKHVDIRVHASLNKGLISCDTWLCLLQELATGIRFTIDISLQGTPKACSGTNWRCGGSVLDTLQRRRVNEYRYQKEGLP
ncbi:uncharacterized protein MYCFIDRAFT_79909 [Pseudocercospora fijiensis CIRAD86]|uniref:F-box domain-containing protein n=1 Tax=Pseudocercospora fijiensis (strain CIRAD86) TaxID=383855 RepID=M2YSM6_PSEFD|nr:uncharacterized protein MYCFIDRAFT_79909 [Pseudocercospora fijiensis CIRAD86]EME80710.1 hypothetical protein MYCFIDRAFT_79909 [Pseudocercospora fijiensis CIRAD86]